MSARSGDGTVTDGGGGVFALALGGGFIYLFLRAGVFWCYYYIGTTRSFLCFS